MVDFCIIFFTSSLLLFTVFFNAIDIAAIVIIINIKCFVVNIPHGSYSLGFAKNISSLLIFYILYHFFYFVQLFLDVFKKL